MTANAATSPPPMIDATHHSSGGRRPLGVDAVLAAVVVVLATAVLSFESLRDLARMCGFTGGLDWLWPICLDAVAYVATRVWLLRGPAWRLGRGLAVGAIGLSLAANGLVHGLGQYGVAPHWLIVVAVGAVPPLMLALTVHLIVTVRADRATSPASPVTGPYTPDRADRDAVDTDADTVEITAAKTSVADRTSDRSAPADQRGPVTELDRSAQADDRSGAGPLSPDRSDEVIAEAVRKEIVKTKTPPSRNAVMRTHGIGADRAKRVIRLATQDSPVAGPALTLVPGPVRPTPSGVRDSDREEVAL